VILARLGEPASGYASLADAMAASVPGDTIEVRGDGPFVTDSLKPPKGVGLTIRAAAGARPLIRYDPAPGPGKPVFLEGSGPGLTLEGLEFQHARPAKAGLPDWIALIVYTGPVRVANCRFVKIWPGNCLHARSSPYLEVRNCEFLMLPGAPAGAVSGSLVEHGRGVLDNCVRIGGYQGFNLWKSSNNMGEIAVELTRNTLVCESAFGLTVSGTGKLFPPEGPDGRIIPGSTAYRVTASANVFDCRSQMMLVADAPEALRPETVGAQFRKALTWRDDRNLYHVHGHRTFLVLGSGGPGISPTPPITGLAAWQRYWDLADTGSLAGEPGFRGGDLFAQALADLPSLRPDDFRLRPDSPGAGAGPNGEDLGADVSLVGPGEAYERWKKTPAYQDWLKATARPK
jgi:hypothetical protein